MARGFLNIIVLCVDGERNFFFEGHGCSTNTSQNT